MFPLKTLLPLAIAAAVVCPRSEPEPAQDGGIPLSEVTGIDDHYQLVFMAVLEGLYRDGVATDVVDALLVKEDPDGFHSLFVYACPICMPAVNAFLAYRGRPELLGLKLPRDTLGDGLSEDTRARCLSLDLVTRFEALNKLVERWVAERLDSMRLTDEEKEVWRYGFEKRRKTGMSFLSASKGFLGMKTCAICDAANGAFELR